MESSSYYPRPDLVQLWIASAVIAVACHQFIFRRVELDEKAAALVFILLVACVAILVLDISLYSASFLSSLCRLAVAAASFAKTSAISILVYRAFFHRLNRFPGPFLARLTKLYAFKQSRSLQYYKELEDMHRKYGDVVRTGPRELSIKRASAHAAVAECRKSVFYGVRNSDDKMRSIFHTRDLETHKLRRRTWEFALGQKSIASYDAAIQRSIGLLLSRLTKDTKLDSDQAQGSRDGQVVDISQLCSWLAYDVMGIVGFGRDFGNLESGAENHAITMMKQSLKMLGQVKPTPWLMNIMLAIPGAGGAMKQFNRYCSSLVYQKQVNWKAKSPEEKAARPNDLMDWFLKTNEEGGPSALPTEEALHEEIRVLVVAGSDTTHGGMTNALFYLSQRPDVYAMLQRRIDGTFPAGPSSFDYKTLASDPHSIELLDAIINETLRLKPGVPSGNPRVTPASGLLIPGDEPCKGEKYPANHGNGNLWIPGDVDIFMPTYLVQRDERYFEKADMWLPERWLKSEESKGLIKARNAWFPFQVGRYNCVGKGVAMHQLRSFLARVALQFDISFPGGKQGLDEFEKGYKDSFNAIVPSLAMEFKERGKCP